MRYTKGDKVVLHKELTREMFKHYGMTDNMKKKQGEIFEIRSILNFGYSFLEIGYTWDEECIDHEATAALAGNISEEIIYEIY